MSDGEPGSSSTDEFEWRARAIKPSGRVWLASAVLAGLRTASNDSLRAGIRDRGTDKNRLNDVQGCFGELVALRIAEFSVPRGTRLLASPMDWDGPTDDVDLTVVLPRSGERRFETKTHLHEVRKRLFLINDVAHTRSRGRAAESYLPVVSQIGAEFALVGRPIPVEHVSHWPVKTFASRPEADPARAIPLADLANRYFQSSWTQIEALLNSSPVAAVVPDLWRAYDVAHSSYGALRRSRPDWNSIGYEELVGALMDVL